MDCEKASLWMVDSKAHEIYTKAGTGEITLRLPMGRGIIGMCINEGKLIRIDDVESHPAFMRSSKMRR
jgi:putative methionine-R-sulfoxide reductase with GAF domain